LAADQIETGLEAGKFGGELAGVDGRRRRRCKKIAGA
jgi:hypothetical protein